MTPNVCLYQQAQAASPHLPVFLQLSALLAARQTSIEALWQRTLALDILTYNSVHIFEMSSYTWEIFNKAWHFKFPAFGLDRLLQIPKSYGVSFGFWMRVNSEEVESQVTSTAMVCIRATFMQIPVENAEFWDSERLPSIILP